MADSTRADAAPPPEPRTIRREDYTPPDWLVATVHLDFDLAIAETRVVATMAIARNGGHARALRLDVDGSWPVALRVDGVDTAWRKDGADAKGGDEALVVDIAADAAELVIETRLAPDRNSQLMGLYASGGMLCTQCEAEGFRRIVPFVDRPDNLAVYTVRMTGDRATFPVLLANGECVETGDAGDGRHYAVWHDPWPKPSYLFALVAGDLVANRDSFTTMSGKTVDLAIYVRDGDLARTGHAMDSLKRAMRWDEEVYGREYDLPVFNIVAVGDFNMGAMENKGLNIFNTKYILADADTATDVDYEGVEGVVAHEYFHNWSGNRVTCRDWFQLSLKEGFTVYRDQSFSADMGSPIVKRIEDVRILRAAQFPEDSGPLAHPIRPDSYQEISNFYTATVYNKGAEVIRMMATLAGPERFRAATDLYFDRHDGEAATCEDFVLAMEDGAGLDLAQFRLWYSQAGTPRVRARIEHAHGGAATLHLDQTVPPTPGQDDKRPMTIPLRIKAFDTAANDDSGEERLVVLDGAGASVALGDFARRPALSINRGFSAPVTIEVDRAPGDLAWLAAHDDDGFARYEALQQLMVDTLLARIGGDDGDGEALITAIGHTLDAAAGDPAFVAEAVILPSEAYLGDQMLVVAPQAIRDGRRALQRDIGARLAERWRALHAELASDAHDLSPAAKGRRRLRGVALAYLDAGGEDGAAIAYAQYRDAGGMTDRQSALTVLAHGHSPYRQQALDDFYARHGDNPLVLDKWFQIQAWAIREDTPERVAELAGHADFSLANPNRVRSLYGAFAGNQASFHRADGAGYRLIADLVIALDPKNPQTAARLVPPLGRWRRFDEARQALMQEALRRILAAPGVSKDVREQAGKSLAG
ncbi:MAG: aminopeptidase N [Sphingomonadales bacterium]|nr:aminopeptidase N [Sphingomonadales bacterium]